MGKVIGVLTLDMSLPDLPPQLPVTRYGGICTDTRPPQDPTTDLRPMISEILVTMDKVQG